MKIHEVEIFKPLVAKTITKLERLTIVENNSKEHNSEFLSDTFIFTLSDGNCFEVLVTSEDTIFKQIRNKQDFIIDFCLEDYESVNSEKISKKIEFPFTIASVIETWAGKDNSFLVAVDFLDHNKQSLLSLLTESDEIFILKSEEIKTIINQMIFDYKFISHRWYGV